MARGMTPRGYNVLKSNEGKSNKAYRCAAGVITIGYGSTNRDDSTAKVLGGPITMGMVITDAQCEELLRWAIENKWAARTDRVLPGVADNVRDSAIDFDFNTGAIDRASWTKHFKAGDMPNAEASLKSWNKGGGKVLAGLVRRRARNWAMIATGDYGPEGGFKPAKSNADAPSPKTPAGPGALGINDRGAEVMELKKNLVELGLLKSAATDLFDQATKTAVEKFQGAHPHLRKDGVVGPATRSAIQRELDMKRKIKNGAKTAGGTCVPAGPAAAVDSRASMWILAIAGVLFVGVLVYVGWKYRDEIRALINRKMGREVV
jgi:lysozyme